MFKLILRCKASEFDGRLSLKLPTPLLLKGQWEVAVTHLEIGRSCAWLVLCDLVDFTFVGDERKRFLEYYRSHNEVSPQYGACTPQLTYVSVVKNHIESINVDVVSLTHEQEKTINYGTGEILCILHFRKS